MMTQLCYFINMLSNELWSAKQNMTYPIQLTYLSKTTIAYVHAGVHKPNTCFNYCLFQLSKAYK